ncbi:MAG: DUF3489 domain-containing protein [Alphaproteobacteria bacterium]
MPKLTDRQTTILATAMKRDDGAVLPVPTAMKLNKAALTVVLKSLLKHQLIAEHTIGVGGEAWRQDDDEQRFGLFITPAGLDAMGIEPDNYPNLPDAEPATASDAVNRAKSNDTAGARASANKRPPRAQRVAVAGAIAVRPGTKQARLVDLLRRKKGATIAEVMVETGWQAHSVRGAISGLVKKKLGLPVDSETVDGRGRVYRIVKAGK